MGLSEHDSKNTGGQGRSRISRFAPGILAAFVLTTPLVARLYAEPGWSIFRPVSVQPPAELRRKADDLYKEQSFRLALDAYRQYLAAASKTDSYRSEAERRVVYCLLKINQWNEALEAAETVVKGYENQPLWKARALDTLGDIYFNITHEGWQIGKKIVRGSDYPKVTGDEKPQRVWRQDEDNKAAIKAWEQAIALYEGLHSDEANQEHSYLALRLAGRLQQYDSFNYWDDAEWKRAMEYDWTIQPLAKYNPTWRSQKKIITLYRRAGDIVPRDANANADAAIQYAAYIEPRKQQWQRRDPITGKVIAELPIAKLDPAAIVEATARKFPRSARAGELLTAAARYRYNQGNFVVAMKLAQEAVERYAPKRPKPTAPLTQDAAGKAKPPYSSWEYTARAMIETLLAKTAALGVATQWHPDQPLRGTLVTHNLKEVQLELYRVNLAAWLQTKEYTASTQTFRNIGTFGGIEDLIKKGERLNAWTVAMADKGDYVPLQKVVTFPDNKTAGAPKEPLRVGTYLVVLTADAGRIRSVAPLIVTDLSLVRKVPTNSSGVPNPDSRSQFYVTNAKTGQPVTAADLQVRTIYYHYNNNNNRRFARVQTGTTDGQGIVELPNWGVEEQKTGALNAEQDEAIAFVGDNRIAVYSTDLGLGLPENSSKPVVEQRVVGYTDRSLYRPKQTVHYRLILTQREKKGDAPPTPWMPRTGTKATVIVNTPKNEKIYEETLTVSNFGTVNGSFTLPQGAPLGEWYGSVTTSDDSGNFSFRVEEYRKPEFAVTVKPVTETAEIGKEVKANIKATYFYGAPVANGRVTWKVFRYPIYDYFPRPIPYYPYDRDDSNDFGEGGPGFGRRGGRYPNPYYFSVDTRTPIAQGMATTDAEGNASVTFKAEPLPQNQDPRPEGKRGFAYSVEVEVMDSARRVVESSGTTRAADRGFAAVLTADKGFYEADKGVTIGITAQDVYNNPVGPDKAREGEAILLQLERKTDGTMEEKPRGTQPVTFNAEGKASVRFSDITGGVFKVRFQGKDAAGRAVDNDSASFFVHGPRDAGFPVYGPRLMVEDRSIAQGDTIRLMIAMPDKDVFALLTQETDARSLWTKVVKVDGYSAVVEIPTRAESVPNVRLGAVIVKDFQMRETATGVVVKRSLAKAILSVKPGKETYRPGEMGTMLIKATDADGKPLAAEVSLAVFDASLLAILPDRTPELAEVFARDNYRYIYPRSAASLGFYPQPIEKNDNPRYYPDGYLPDLYAYAQMRDENSPVRSQGGGGMGGFGGAPGGRGGGVNRRMANGALADAPSPAMTLDVANAPKAKAAEKEDAADKKQETQEPNAPVKVRSNLSDLAFWTPAVVTDPKTGEATVSFAFPDNLTEWQMEAAGLTEKVVVGNAEGNVITDKKLTVRLAAPRFFVERDRLTLSAVVRNDLDKEQTITVKLDADPKMLGFDRETETTVTLKPKTEGRVEFPARVIGPGGMVTVRASALSPGESDAVEQTFPALAYGVQKMLAQAGTMNPDKNTQTISFDIPKEHKAGSAALLVTVQPGLASTMLDALPYLADYPYGCIEQTMSRFLPAVLVSRALQDSGADLKVLRERAAELKKRAENSEGFGQEKATNASTDQTGYTYPAGRPNSLQVAPLAEGLWHTKRWENPVFDAAKLAEMQSEGMNRLINAQRSDGGWGWWPDSPSADAYMSAYVMYGLASAKQAGVPVPQGNLDRGFANLERLLTEDLVRRKDWHEAVWSLYALSLKGGKAPDGVKKAITGIFDSRASLTVYGKALLTLAMVNYGDDRAQVMSRNLRDAFEIDRERGTATPVKPAGVPWYWWRWYCDDEESVGWALRAFTAVKDDKSGADELSPLLVRYLVDRKRGSIWRSTRSTAMIVHALADYLKASGELSARSKVTVTLKGENGNGKDRMARVFEFTPDTALLLDREFLVPTSLIGAGKQTVTITREGTGKVYWSAACQFVTQEEKITGVGDALQVNRRYFRLLDGGKREELKEGVTLRSGDNIEVEMAITAKNEMDYVLFEDMKPAGCEPLEQLSGFSFGEGLYAHSELRDTKVAFFVDHMPLGRHALRYRLRAETPGTFHALPTNGYAMYAPDVRALSDSELLTVKDVTP